MRERRRPRSPWITPLLALASLIALAPANASADERSFFDLMLSPMARMLFEGSGAGHELVEQRLGGPILDFRGPEYHRFRLSFSPAEQARLEFSLRRLRAHLLRELRKRPASEAKSLLRTLARKELLPNFALCPVDRCIQIFEACRPAEPLKAHAPLASGDLTGVSEAIRLSRPILDWVGPGIDLGRIRGPHFVPLQLKGADLRLATVDSTDILKAADLRDADLSYAILFGARLIFTDLRGARLTGAELRGAALNGALIAGADLRETDLRDAELAYVREWESALFTGARFNENTSLPFDRAHARRLGMVFVDSELAEPEMTRK